MRFIKLLLFITLILSVSMVSAQDRPIEIMGDRTILYPQKMELTGNESLLDILQRYPEMLESGFNDLLTRFEPESAGAHNAGYQLRVDNVPIAGNMRNALMTIKAKDVKQVQICDNAGVAKGTGGIQGVIDVNMLRAQEGTHGMAEVQVATDGMLNPVINVTHGSETNDVFILASYDKPGHKDGVKSDNTYAFAEVTSRFSSKDKLLSYFSLKNTDNWTDKDGMVAYNDATSLLARFRWFHTFNKRGTELLTLAGYQYDKTPTSADNSLNNLHRNKTVKSGTTMLMLELSTPLFKKDFTMMAGWEADFTHHNMSLKQSLLLPSLANSETTSMSPETYATNNKYNVNNNDLYVLFDYKKGKFHFTLGDRLQFWHYNMNSQKAGRWSRNVMRNLWQASIVVTPAKAHQLQIAYNRRVIHPAYMDMMPEKIPETAETTIMGNPDLKAITADVYKLAYGYSTKKLTAKAGLSYIHTRGHLLQSVVYDDMFSHTFLNDGKGDTWKAEVSATYTSGRFSITAGGNYYRFQSKEGNSITQFATGRLTSTYRVKWDIYINGTVLLFSGESPIRKAHHNCCAYGQVSLSKSFGSHLKALLQWHDIFESQHSACIGSVSYLF